jgi:hypothetical protein
MLQRVPRTLRSSILNNVHSYETVMNSVKPKTFVVIRENFRCHKRCIDAKPDAERCDFQIALPFQCSFRLYNHRCWRRTRSARAIRWFAGNDGISLRGCGGSILPYGRISWSAPGTGVPCRRQARVGMGIVLQIDTLAGKSPAVPSVISRRACASDLNANCL